jgi:hypothetical protein
MFRPSKSKLAHATVVVGTLSLLLSSAFAGIHGAGGTASGWREPVRLNLPPRAIVAKGTISEFDPLPTSNPSTGGLGSNKPKGGRDGDFFAPPDQANQVPDLIELYGSGDWLEVDGNGKPIPGPSRAGGPPDNDRQTQSVQPAQTMSVDNPAATEPADNQDHGGASE